jgi:flagella basal body P-ring formation protein FlgA
VHRGEVIEASDLMAVRVGVDPALTPIPAADLQSLVGQRAAMDLAAGGLVTRQDVTASVLPAEGMSVVGVSLPAGGLPGTALQAGDRVRIVLVDPNGAWAAGAPRVELSLRWGG